MLFNNVMYAYIFIYVLYVHQVQQPSASTDMVANPSCAGQLKTGKIFFLRRIWSRETGFGCPVPRQPACSPHTSRLNHLSSIIYLVLTHGIPLLVLALHYGVHFFIASSATIVLYLHLVRNNFVMERASHHSRHVFLKKIMNASRPSEHPPVRGKNVKTSFPVP